QHSGSAARSRATVPCSTSTPAPATTVCASTFSSGTERRLRGRTRQCATMMFVRERMVDVDLGDLDRWCRVHLSAGVDEVLFRDGHLSTVLGVRLSSRQPVVVKVRRRAERLQACWMAHCQLF